MVLIALISASPGFQQPSKSSLILLR
uniref:Uncharacterized protein n=1 Tax=Anguilla anguilla TaxID=7936 RepID=A0A0E9Q0P5_ANGAN